MLTVNRSVSERTAAGFYDPSTGGFKGAVPYISFEVPVGSIDEDESLSVSQRIRGIREGNAVIALRNRNATDPETGMPVILWSWHIWITDGYDADQDGNGDGLAPVGFLAPDENGIETVVPLSPLNLGWSSTDTLSFYRNRTVFLRVAQEDARSGAEPIVFKVTQAIPFTRAAVSTGTTYQWGRKDPFVPSASSLQSWYSTYLKDAYSPEGYVVHDRRSEYLYIRETSQQGQSLASLGLSWAGYASNASHAIQHPNLQYTFSFSGYGLGDISTTDSPQIPRWYYAGWIPPEYELTGSTYYDQGRYDKLKLPPYLWNRNAKLESNDNHYSIYVSSASYHVTKTVYDPCPPGFCVSSFFNFENRVISSRRVAMDLNNDGVVNYLDQRNGIYYSSFDGKDLIYIPPGKASIGWRNPYFHSAQWIGEIFFAGYGYASGVTDENDTATIMKSPVRPILEQAVTVNSPGVSSYGIDGQRHDLSGTQWE